MSPFLHISSQPWRYAIYCYLLAAFSCTTPAEEKASEYYVERHRPQFHFSPEEMWMNDPNGMVFYEGEYHLFYQYHPEDIVWGPMHWGHAVSTDLVHWEHLPIALYPDKLGLIFSGSAVVDWNNTSGFGESGKPPLVAIFTHHLMEGERSGADDFQIQSIAYSNDKGRSWTKYEGNPVLPNPGIRDFRDPKVIWHEPSSQWVMVFAAQDHVKLYGSPDLKAWELLSTFGHDIGSHDGVWECPDLFPLQLQGEEKWVLLQSMGDGNPNGGSGTQYFVGDFDGTHFTVDSNFMKLLGWEEPFVPEGEVFEDFETGYENWTVEGTAMGAKPATGTSSDKGPTLGIEGEGFVNSFAGKNAATGKLVSKSFTIEKDAINFKVAGGNHRGRTAINLLVDGKLIRTADGGNNLIPKWKGWDVSGFKGLTATIEIVDNYTEEWGYIMVDQIVFADEVAYEEKQKAIWIDAGKDNYAGVTWSDVPDEDGRRIFLGWMSNWQYAQQVPTEKWRSAMTLPRAMELTSVDGIPRLVTKPVAELKALRKGEAQPITGSNSQVTFEKGLAEFEMTFPASGFELAFTNEAGEELLLSSVDGEIILDRTKAGGASFSGDFAGRHSVQRIAKAPQIQLSVFIDHSSIEVFVDDGLNVLTDLFFPSEPFTRMEVRSESISAARYWELKRIWN